MNARPEQQIALPSIADLRAVPHLHRQFAEILASDSDIDVHGHAVERITTPCIQLLVAAARSLDTGSGRRFRLVAPSEPLADALRDLGLEAMLDEWR
jgi:anti-anti-sigma regulatory factor